MEKKKAGEKMERRTTDLLYDLNLVSLRIEGSSVSLRLHGDIDSCERNNVDVNEGPL